jgi:carboxypeptidase family protein
MAMSLAKQNSHTALLRLLLGLAVLLTSANGIAAQAQDEETKSAVSRTGVLSGRVINDNGQPVSQATIYITAPMGLPQPRITFTNEAGNFQVNGLDSLVYSVGASSPSYITAPREPDSLPPYYRIGDSVTISLLKGGVITGTVTSATGGPMVQAGVRAIFIRDANGKPPVGPRFQAERQTDDRGVYRIYGLTPGTYLVSAGGRGPYGYSTNAYDTDAPTYAPSATRDTAAEIIVRAGEDTTGVDIRYRGEPGYAVSGVVSGPTTPNSLSSININLMHIVNGVPQANAYSFQTPSNKGFAFYGIADGDYDLIAQSYLGQGETTASEPRRITVKGADITGIEIVLKGLASISGHVNLEASTAAECKNKRQPLFSETLLMVRRSEKNTPKDQLAFQNTFAQSSPDKSGDFVLRNLAPGQFSFNVRFFAKYWYLRSIAREATAGQPAPGRVGPANRLTDVARNGVSVKFGERLSGLTVLLAEGAASLRGALKLADGESVPAKLYLQLVPAEKEHAEDVLRFFTAMVSADGTFAFNNLPPGRYWALARIAADNEPKSDSKLRSPEEAETRAQIRRAAESNKTAIEFKPCQNVSDYQLPFTISANKN